MCGRLACTLCPEDIRRACSLKDKKTQKYYEPEWINSNPNWNYHPSHNLAPTEVSPVLVSGKHFPDIHDSERAVVHPMIWGMIPPWHKGSYNDHHLSTNNCRLEHMTESRLYSEPLRQGRRCVIVCDGFYEWQTTKGSHKQPYFIYVPQKDGIKIEDDSTWNCSWNDEKGWQGPQLLKLAGLFNVWRSPQGENLYNYTVITMESGEILNWCHHRMPAILHDEEEVMDWIDYGNVPMKAALHLLHPTKCLSWHAVDTLVNNSRNKDRRCNKPMLPKPKSASSKFMTSWLNIKKKEVKEENENDSSKSPSPSKRLKVEKDESE